MPAIFEKIDRIKPFYDLTYKVVLFVCKVLLVIDIADYKYGGCGPLHTVYSGPGLERGGRSDLHVVHGGALCGSGHPPGRPYPHDRIWTVIMPQMGGKGPGHFRRRGGFDFGFYYDHRGLEDTPPGSAPREPTSACPRFPDSGCISRCPWRAWL